MPCRNHCTQGRHPCPTPHSCGLWPTPAQQDTPPENDTWARIDRLVSAALGPLAYIGIGMASVCFAMLISGVRP